MIVCASEKLNVFWFSSSAVGLIDAIWLASEQAAEEERKMAN